MDGWMHLKIHINRCVYIYINIFMCMCMCIYIYIYHVYMDVFMHAFMYMYVCMYVIICLYTSLLRCETRTRQLQSSGASLPPAPAIVGLHGLCMLYVGLPLLAGVMCGKVWISLGLKFVCFFFWGGAIIRFRPAWVSGV